MDPDRIILARCTEEMGLGRHVDCSSNGELAFMAKV